MFLKEIIKNTTMKTGSIMALLAVMISFGFAQNNPLMDVMHQHRMQIQDQTLTGDPDYDFATLMLLHSKGGISMSNVEISLGVDKRIRSLAREIKEREAKDMDVLKEFKNAHRNSEPDTAFLQEMKTHLEDSYNDMQNTMQMRGNTDQLFRTIMSIHHEHGEEMMRIYLKHGKHEALKTLARKMLDEREKQRILLENNP